jgi:hypothetical protein
MDGDLQSSRVRSSIPHISVTLLTQSDRYDLAVLYLEQCHYDLEMAVEAYHADEAWEKKHPLAKSKGKSKVYQRPLRSLT